MKKWILILSSLISFSSFAQSTSTNAYDIYLNDRAACLSKLTEQDTGECLSAAEKRYRDKLKELQHSDTSRNGNIEPMQDFCFGTVGADRNICELQRTILYSPYANSPIVVIVPQ